MNQGDYRVELDVYNGPLELLLFLIKKEEVDIHDIPISRITSQYLAHVEMIRRIDINLAGEFLVLAATLMEIKSRMLNPQPVAESQSGVSTQELSDPRRELVEQLLQYKQFKDAANALARRADVEQQRFGRTARREAGRTPLDIDDINLFTLIDAFNAIMASVGHSAFGHDVVYDDTPISLHQADILDRLMRDGPLTLQAMFTGRKSRSEMIGLFLAMLELIRMKKVIIEQPEPDSPIGLRMNPNAPAADTTVPAMPENPETPASGVETPSASTLDS
jgi:segregation and condensation protein A